MRFSLLLTALVISSASARVVRRQEETGTTETAPATDPVPADTTPATSGDTSGQATSGQTTTSGQTPADSSSSTTSDSSATALDPCVDSCTTSQGLDCDCHQKTSDSDVAACYCTQQALNILGDCVACRRDAGQSDAADSLQTYVTSIAAYCYEKGNTGITITKVPAINPQQAAQQQPNVVIQQVTVPATAKVNSTQTKTSTTGGKASNGTTGAGGKNSTTSTSGGSKNSTTTGSTSAKKNGASLPAFAAEGMTVAGALVAGALALLA